VWALFEVAARRFPDAPVIVERDAEIPPFESLAAEADTARRRHRAALATGSDDSPRAAAPLRAGARGATWRGTQKDFFERVIDKPLGHDHAGVERLLDDARPVRAARGMRVYSDAYTASLRRALATNLPALAAVLRRDDFDALAAAYLRAHPPRGHGFEPLGASLAAFLRGHDFAAGYGVAREVLAELAALEQAQLEVQHAADAAAPLPPDALAAIPADAWEDARFAFVPALRVVFASHDVLPAVEAVARGEAPDRPAPGDVAYLVYRAGDKVRTERIAPGEARALEALLAGVAFSEACAGDPELGARALVAAAARGLVARRLDGSGTLRA
jgi:hypothetical protein